MLLSCQLRRLVFALQSTPFQNPRSCPERDIGVSISRTGSLLSNIGLTQINTHTNQPTEGLLALILEHCTETTLHAHIY